MLFHDRPSRSYAATLSPWLSKWQSFLWRWGKQVCLAFGFGPSCRLPRSICLALSDQSRKRRRYVTIACSYILQGNFDFLTLEEHVHLVAPCWKALGLLRCRLSNLFSVGGCSFGGSESRCATPLQICLWDLLVELSGFHPLLTLGIEIYTAQAESMWQSSWWWTSFWLNWKTLVHLHTLSSVKAVRSQYFHYSSSQYFSVAFRFISILLVLLEPVR